MSSPLNPGYYNQINVVSLGESFNAALYTDRKFGSGVAGGLAPMGASGHAKINRTVTTPDLPDAAVVYSLAGSGSFNPETLP